MTKAAYQRKHLVGDFLAVRGDQSTVIMVGSMPADRQAGARAVAESLQSDLQAEGRERHWAWYGF